VVKCGTVHHLTVTTARSSQLTPHPPFGWQSLAGPVLCPHTTTQHNNPNHLPPFICTMLNKHSKVTEIKDKHWMLKELVVNHSFHLIEWDGMYTKALAKPPLKTLTLLVERQCCLWMSRIASSAAWSAGQRKTIWSAIRQCLDRVTVVKHMCGRFAHLTIGVSLGPRVVPLPLFNGTIN
jgi:uncharacterized membrane protein